MRNIYWIVFAVLGSGLLLSGIALWSQLVLPDNQQSEPPGAILVPTNSMLQSASIDGDAGYTSNETGNQAINDFQSLLPSISNASNEFPKVFAECNALLESMRAQLLSLRHYRPGELSGKFQVFARSAPESRFVTERVGTYTNRFSVRGKYEKVLKFTEEEVEAGRQRNAAARMAVLDHLLHASDNDPPYMQHELVDLMWQWWWQGGKYREEDNISGEDLLHALAMNPARPAALRFAAATFPPGLEQQDVFNAILVAVLQDERISDPLMDGREVSNAVRLLKDHGGEEGQRLLSEASSSVRWKQALINQALGIPPPPSEEREKPLETMLDLDIAL